MWPATGDFIQLSSRVAGEDLTAFFQGWLYGERTPPMPGRPQWQPRKGGDKPGANGAAPGHGAKGAAPTPGGPKANAAQHGKPA